MSVEVIELVEKGRRCKMHCEAKVDGKVVLDGEAIVMVPARESSPRPAKMARGLSAGRVSAPYLLGTPGRVSVPTLAAEAGKPAHAEDWKRMSPQSRFILSLDPTSPPQGLEGAVVAIGNFDGVHRGHRAVIARAKALAQQLGRPCAVADLRAASGRFFRRRRA